MANILYQGVERLTVVDRLENLRQRLKLTSGWKYQKIKAGKLKLSQAENKFWTSPDWNSLDFVHVRFTAHCHHFTYTEMNRTQ